MAEAFGWGWPEMVEVALVGVESSWLDEDAKRALRDRIAATPEAD